MVAIVRLQAPERTLRPRGVRGTGVARRGELRVSALRHSHDLRALTRYQLSSFQVRTSIAHCRGPRAESAGGRSAMSWEAMLPLGIISAMFFVMASSQYVVHTTIYGKPKHPRHDAWDRAMDERDQRLKDEYGKAHQQ